MKTRLVVAVVVLVVLATGAWAQGLGVISPRASGMGGASIAVADDAAAWYQNPAGLAALAVPAKEGSEYGNDILLAYADMDDMNAWGLTWSGWKPADNLGFGAGYGSADDIGTALGAGFGAGLKDVPLSAGLNVVALHADGHIDLAQLGENDDETILNAGLLYRLAMGEDKDPLKIGVTVTDVTDEFGVGPFWNIGLAWKPISDLLLAVDFNDVTDEIDDGETSINGGAEYAFGSDREWRARVGVMDNGDESDFTFGVGYQAKQWRADFSYVDTDPEAIWSFGVGVNL